jgi:hypothetical protein
MNNPLVKRFIGLILFGVGIALACWLKSAHDTGGTIEDRAIIFTPVLLLFGFAAMINPALMIGRGEFSTAPAAIRVLSVLITVLSLGIGLWLRFVVFKDWVVQR